MKRSECHNCVLYILLFYPHITGKKSIIDVNPVCIVSVFCTSLFNF